MDKSAIRNFAIEARKVLMKSAETEAGFYGVIKDGCKNPIQKGNDFEVYETIAGTENRIYGADIKRRANLVKAVETLGFEQVIEETAYTWFNRIIAIRFMEVNDYLPTRVRVLSSETGSNTPDIVTQFLDVDLNMTPEELEKVQKAKDENRYDDAFRMLFIKQCNELNAILPGLFEKTDDYMELLLKLSYTSDGVVRMLVDSIDENNFNVETEGQVEIIGWMYQYYNTELKDDTFAKLKKNVKITKERIPAATQLFTPDWIVRYMVENSVGRVWIEHLRAVDPFIDEKEKAEEFGWKYYLPEAEQEEEVQNQLVEIRKNYANLEPKDINCIDPCMGSGHILVYMFEVLMDIYRSEGFSERDAVFSILENNIRGLDIDKRAYQLSYFDLMMKARSYNRTFFRGKQDEEGNRIFIEPSVYAIEESNDVNREQLKYFGAGLSELEKNNTMNQIVGLLDSLKDAKEYGSILEVECYDWKMLFRFADRYDIGGQISFDTYGIDDTKKKLIKLIKQGYVMSDKYWVVSTNPPYMGLKSGMTGKLVEKVKKDFSDSKSDMYAVFIEKCMNISKKHGLISMVTQHSWMFQSSYKKLRNKVVKYIPISLLHLGAKAFEEIGGEVVQTAAYVIQKSNDLDLYSGIYVRLVEGKDQHEKEKEFFNDSFKYTASVSKFLKTEDAILSYWLNDIYYDLFEKPKVSSVGYTFQGIITGQTEKYLRLWFEPDFNRIDFMEENASRLKECDCYYPYIKGGSFRRWYGNLEYVIHWNNNGEDYVRSRTENREYFFKPGVAWSDLCTGKYSCRYVDKGFLFDASGPMLFANQSKDLYSLCGYFNSKVFQSLLDINSQGLHYGNGAIASQPIQLDACNIDELVKRCIELSKKDWDSHETSWNFKINPLVSERLSSSKEEMSIEDAYQLYEEKARTAFYELKKLEEQINEQLLTAYGLGSEMSSEVSEDEVTLSMPNQRTSIVELISYLVGCMFGRYSISQEGLIFAGGEWIKERYDSYQPDQDGIIPITDSNYFKDDITNRLVALISMVFGKDTLERNLDYIANVLGNKGNTSRDSIRNYFVNDFFKEHCSMYSATSAGKRPIYWLFDSGKQNGFKCLIYMHRYNKDTLNLIRSEYLRKTEDAVENALKNAEYIIQTSASAVERAKATKDRDKYVKQLNEMKIYYQALSHLALQKIEIDLDDGVKHNYQLFQGVEVIVDGGKKQKVNLLAKI